jgi:O-antigen/teichoic acid export membrane protein
MLPRPVGRIQGGRPVPHGPDSRNVPERSTFSARRFAIVVSPRDGWATGGDMIHGTHRCLDAIARRISDLSRAGRHSRYLPAIFGQSGLSLFNFALNIVLMRELSAHDYGTFALCVVLATLAYTVNGSLASGPLMVFGMSRQGRPSRKAVEALLSAVNVAILVVVFLAAIPLVAVLSGEDGGVSLIAAAFIAAFAARMYTRTFAYARQRPNVAMTGDLSSIVAASAILIGAAVSDVRLTLPLALAGVTCGNIAAMGIEIRMMGLGIRLPHRPASLRHYLPIWRQVRWSLLGAATTFLQSQAHSVFVSLMYGPAAFAPLAAGQVVFAPTRTVMIACLNIVIPDVVTAAQRNEHERVLRIFKYSTFLFTVMVLTIGAAVALFWPPIFDVLYASKYAHHPMGLIVAIWCGIFVCGAFCFAPSAILQALREYRALAYGTIYGSLISSASVLILLSALGPEWSLLGVLMGNVFNAQYIVSRALTSTRRLAQHVVAEPA